jgi:hypothetical protein
MVTIYSECFGKFLLLFYLQLYGVQAHPLEEKLLISSPLRRTSTNGCADGSVEQVFQSNVMVGCNGAYTRHNFRGACSDGWHVARASEYFSFGGRSVKPKTMRWVDVTWDIRGYETSLDNYAYRYDSSNGPSFNGLSSTTSCVWVSVNIWCYLSFVDKDYGGGYGCHCYGKLSGNYGVVCVSDSAPSTRSVFFENFDRDPVFFEKTARSGNVVIGGGTATFRGDEAWVRSSQIWKSDGVLIIEAEINKKEYCSDHGIAITRSSVTPQFWSLGLNQVNINFNCDVKYIYGYGKSVSVSCPLERIYKIRIRITPSNIIFQDDHCSDIELADTIFTGDVWIWFGSDCDSHCSGATWNWVSVYGLGEPTLRPTANPTPSPTWDPTHSPTPLPTDDSAESCLPAGVRTNVSMEEVSDWSMVYSAPYSHITQSSVFSTIKDGCVFFGAKQRSSDRSFYIGAFADASLVLRRTKSALAAVYNNGAYWYNYPTKAIGFANDSRINLYQCDIESTHCNHRMCWHLEGNTGGWSAGCNTMLNDDNAWFKHVYSGYCCPPPTETPTRKPTDTPTKSPTVRPTETPSSLPSEKPSQNPTSSPTENPTTTPTEIPTSVPTKFPTKNPTFSPSESPTESPTSMPTEFPSPMPTIIPTASPTVAPTETPTAVCVDKHPEFCALVLNRDDVDCNYEWDQQISKMLRKNCERSCNACGCTEPPRKLELGSCPKWRSSSWQATYEDWSESHQASRAIIEWIYYLGNYFRVALGATSNIVFLRKIGTLRKLTSDFSGIPKLPALYSLILKSPASGNGTWHHYTNVVYIGQTRNLYERVMKHSHSTKLQTGAWAEYIYTEKSNVEVYVQSIVFPRNFAESDRTVGRSIAVSLEVFFLKLFDYPLNIEFNGGERKLSKYADSKALARNNDLETYKKYSLLKSGLRKSFADYFERIASIHSIMHEKVKVSTPGDMCADMDCATVKKFDGVLEDPDKLPSCCL